MVRYTKIIRRADEEGATPSEICRLLGFDPSVWYEAWAAARIYREDGGRRFTARQFVDSCAAETPPEVAGGIDEFMKMDL